MINEFIIDFEKMHDNSLKKNKVDLKYVNGKRNEIYNVIIHSCICV